MWGLLEWFIKTFRVEEENYPNMYDIEEVLRVVYRLDDVIAYTILKNGTKRYLRSEQIRHYQRKNYEIIWI